MQEFFPRPLVIIIFRPEMLRFHPYSILTVETMVGFVIYCVLRSFLPINSSVFFVNFLQMFAILEIVSINLTNFQLSLLIETLSFEIRKYNFSVNWQYEIHTGTKVHFKRA